MSQHYFHTTYQDRPVSVLMGWDRPLGHYFLVIEYSDEESDDYLYSNLNEPHPFSQSLTDYRAILDQFGIKVPETMFTETTLDQIYNVGNRLVIHPMTR